MFGFARSGKDVRQRSVGDRPRRDCRRPKGAARSGAEAAESHPAWATFLCGLLARGFTVADGCLGVLDGSAELLAAVTEDRRPTLCQQHQTP